MSFFVAILIVVMSNICHAHNRKQEFQEKIQKNFNLYPFLDQLRVDRFTVTVYQKYRLVTGFRRPRF
jgi:hypothetical protein